MKKMKVRYIMMMLVGVALVACDKTPIPVLSEGNDPIYTLKGQVNGEAIDYNVGLESVVMNRGVKNEGGLISYYGEMESANDNEKIRVEFIQLETPLTAGDIQVFNNSNVPFMVHERTKVTFDFGDFGGGEDDFFRIKDKKGKWIETSTHELFEYKYNVIEARFGELLNKEYLNFTIKYGFEERELNSGFESFGGEDSIHLVSEETYAMHEWYIDGVLVGTAANYDGPIRKGKHRINHRVMDANNNQSETNRLVRFNGGKQIWALKIKFKEEYPFETYNYGRLIVSMFKDGEWYTSDHAVSNKEQSAKIENVELVTLEQGQLPLVAFNIHFNAVLTNATKSDSLSLSNMAGKFVVGLE